MSSGRVRRSGEATRRLSVRMIEEGPDGGPGGASPLSGMNGDLNGGQFRTMQDAIQALERWRDVHGHSPETARLDRWVLKAIGKHPRDATVLDLEAVVLRSRNRGTRSTYSARIKSVYRVLRASGVVPEWHRPDEALPNLKAPRGRPRPLPEADVAVLLAEARAPFDAMFRIALLTGARAMELWAMEGCDLTDGANGPELLLHGKGAKEETVPAHPQVVELIEGFGTLGRLFPQWSAPMFLSRAGCREMRRVLGHGELHQLRHTFATRLLRATSDVVTVSQLMRHSSIQTTLIYAAVADDAKARAIHLLSA